MDQATEFSSTYVLEQAILGPRKRLPLSESEFLALKKGREVLSNALEFEQRYDLLIGNFIEMELSLTEICLRSTVEPQFAYADAAMVLQEANRQLVNLLTAAKSYVDQVKQDFKSASLSPRFSESAATLLSNEYDGSIEYRFMEALRNHTQHHAFPATKFSGAAILDHDANDWVESVQIFAKKEDLFRNKDFKQKFLEALPAEINLRAYGREYVRCLSRVHIALRHLVHSEVLQSRSTVDATIQHYEGDDKHSSLGLCARKIGKEPEDVPVLNDWDQVREKLVLKNSRPADLWPRQRPNETSADELRALRSGARHSIEDAARTVVLSPERWRRYEAGLRIPESISFLYKLLTDQHPTFKLSPRDSGSSPS